MPKGRSPFAASMARRTANTSRRISRALFMCVVTSSLNLEPDILQGLCSAAVQVRCQSVVAAPGRQIAAGDPSRRAMARRAQLVEARLGRGERSLRAVELILLEQCAPQYEVRV